MGFSRQEYWNGLPFPPPEDHPYPGIKLVSLRYTALAGRFFTLAPTGKPDTIKGNSKLIMLFSLILI